MELKEENWFYCPQCDCVSYGYGCECFGSFCNCGGCDKCEEIRKLVEIAVKTKNHPPIEWLKEVAKDLYGDDMSDENRKLREIFGVWPD